ncbi:DsbA family protein [Azospirillum sp.]|uniref:DsbA family protein n=1 Tax=Azospirillum sp. TaxID=34012 RepID=UPI003D743C48
MLRIRPALLAAAAVALAVLSPAAQAQSVPAEQRQAIEQVVREYLLKHPEVIVEAIEELQKRERAEEERKGKQGLVQNKDKLFNDPASPIAGNPKGDVTLVEFFDYQCGYCKSVQADVQKLIKDDGKLKFVFKEFPILGPASVTASKAALAARAQGKYEAYHNALMAHRGQLDEATILKLASSVGLDTDRLKKDMESAEVQQALGANLALAEQLGIRGTPGFVVGDRIVPGAIKLDDMKKLVAEARKG